MKAEDFNEDVERTADDLKKVIRKLPKQAGAEVLASIDDNFRNQGFYGSPWVPRKDDPDPGRGILMGPGSGTLRRSITLDVKGKTIRFETDRPYAEIHNEGGSIQQEIPVTTKMRKFFWAKYYSTKNEKWKAMAMSKRAVISRKIDMPQRQFMGEHPALENLLEKLLFNLINPIFGS